MNEMTLDALLRIAIAVADPGGVPGVPRNPPFPSCYDDLTYDAHAALGARRRARERASYVAS